MHRWHGFFVAFLKSRHKEERKKPMETFQVLVMGNFVGSQKREILKRKFISSKEKGFEKKETVQSKENLFGLRQGSLGEIHPNKHKAKIALQFFFQPPIVCRRCGRAKNSVNAYVASW
jgi:hypothetical protein